MEDKKHITDDMVVVLSDSETFTSIDGSIVMLLAPGDSRRFSDEGVVEPLDIYDLTDPVDLRRLADAIEAAS
jgi:hypothetical protein